MNSENIFLTKQIENADILHHSILQSLGGGLRHAIHPKSTCLPEHKDVQSSMQGQSNSKVVLT